MATLVNRQAIAYFLLGVAFSGGASAETVSRSCWRPAPPVMLDYKSREVFQEEREAYFAQASFYITCIDMWIEDARRRYQEMFAQEVETYQLERKEVFEELRQLTRAPR